MGQRVREAHVDAAPLRIGHLRNADRRRTVARRVGQQHRRLEARDQALVAVGARIGERVDRLGVLDDAADVVQRHFRQAAVLVTGEQVLAVLGQRSEEHTSELQSLMRTSYAVFCLKKKKSKQTVKKRLNILIQIVNDITIIEQQINTYH